MPRLTAREAERLWRAWKHRGDRGARDRLVESYVPMVKYLASKKVRELPTHVELDDLVSCGLLAVVAAVERFDPAKGASFEQYAWMRVQGAIFDELRRADRVSRGTRSMARRLEDAREKVQREEGREPHLAELAAAIGVDVVDVEQALVELDRARVMRLDGLTGRADAGQQTETLGETVPDEVDRYGERLEVVEAVRLMREVLTDRELTVLLRRAYGEHGLDLAAEMGCTESRVSQILTAAQAKMRKAA